jgi:protein-disulfide isomerase
MEPQAAAFIALWVRQHPEEIAKALASLRPMIPAAREDWIFGNPTGSRTVVLFQDRLGPGAGITLPVLAALSMRDTDIRVVVKELPASAMSTALASAAIASKAQGDKARRLFEFGLLATKGDLDESAITAAARFASLDEGKLARDRLDPAVQDYLRATRKLATDIGVTQGPVIVIGRDAYTGIPTVDALETAVAKEQSAARQ